VGSGLNDGKAGNIVQRGNDTTLGSFPGGVRRPVGLGAVSGRWQSALNIMIKRIGREA